MIKRKFPPRVCAAGICLLFMKFLAKFNAYLFFLVVCERYNFFGVAENDHLIAFLKHRVGRGGGHYFIILENVASSSI